MNKCVIMLEQVVQENMYLWYIAAPGMATYNFKYTPHFVVCPCPSARYPYYHKLLHTTPGPAFFVALCCLLCHVLQPPRPGHHGRWDGSQPCQGREERCRLEPDRKESDRIQPKDGLRNGGHASRSKHMLLRLSSSVLCFQPVCNAPLLGITTIITLRSCVFWGISPDTPKTNRQTAYLWNVTDILYILHSACSNRWCDFDKF